MCKSHRPCLVLCLLLAAPTPSLASGDALLLAGGGLLRTLTLPNGPVTTDIVLSASSSTSTLLALAAHPDGRLFGVRGTQVGFRKVQTLVTIADDGSETVLGELDLSDDVHDLAVDSRGRLFAQVNQVQPCLGCPHFFRLRAFLHRLDPGSGEIRSSLDLGLGVGGIARAPNGLWVVGDDLVFVDPETGWRQRRGPGVGDDMFPARAVEADATGALWILDGNDDAAPPRPARVFRLDPTTQARKSLDGGLLGMTRTALAVRQGCQETATVRCLQGGRFLAEVTWSGFEGDGGAAHAAPARSADSALFSFFDPANWELLVRVLDACSSNGRFWVFASASTTVAYTLTVTDLGTGQTQTYENPLGQVARAITDTSTFDGCSP